MFYTYVYHDPLRQVAMYVGKGSGKRAKVTCPHCLSVGGMPGMGRHHFDQCKHRSVLAERHK